MKRPAWVTRWLAKGSEEPASEAVSLPDSAATFEGGADPLAEIHQVDITDPESCRRAVAALARAAGSQLERPALGACLAAHARGSAPSSLAILAAKLFFRRGQSSEALSLLEGLDEPDAWMMLAEFYAASGQTALTRQWLQRLVARDIDTPGALDRLRELSRQEQEQQRGPAEQVTLLGEYAPNTALSIVREVGRGGAATVYEAVDGVLQRSVALKVYHHPGPMRQHLLREASMAVRLAGPHVIRLFDVDPEQGWIAMEWAAGGTLKERLTTRRADLPETLGWFRPLVEALAAIHESGHVHADLKPANVLFRADGSPVLSDFGLAVPIGAQHQGASTGYISPERAAGHPAIPGDDVYALGRLLQQALEVWPERQQAGRQAWSRLAEQLLSRERPPGARQVLALLPSRR